LGRVSARAGLKSGPRVCAAAATAAWAIVWTQIPAPPRARFLLTAGVVLGAVGTWSPRPQVFSLLLLATTVALLPRRRYRLPPIIFLLLAHLPRAVVICA